MNYAELTTGDRIEIFHHFSTGCYMWRKGTVKVEVWGQNGQWKQVLFVPDGRKTGVLILPHRMEEVRPIQSETLAAI